jgi:hypothetical protein
VAAGFNLDQNCDVGYCDALTIGGGAEIDLACRWDFDERHWQRMSFVPVGRGVVTIVSEWFERDVRQDRLGTHETVILWTRLRNDSGEVITVIPTVVVTPSRYRH